MIKATSKIKLNHTKIKQLNQAAITALEQTAEALHTEVVQAQVVPRDMGNLQNESTFVDDAQAGSGKVSLVSTTPYARRLYYHPEYDFKTDENPFARGEWYEDWLPGGKYEKFTPQAFKEFYRRAGGL
ncbi:MAG: hypothetical protein SOR93_03650 [Clostridiales Family XIII bacterium]|uniref:Uncharacterized protein n=1 Tax=Hominibacterium faecale TaxID=2839743 RepID=A0A9J6QZW6_9FIRM|nr:hypothetical protein [Hominibacterium faecale]MCU7380973.1 hypothetical protein [Hominibacterium faecale]MDY3010342.1 hypothetical protein [Clostridiales Family XIII bacterium]